MEVTFCRSRGVAPPVEHVVDAGMLRAVFLACLLMCGPSSLGDVLTTEEQDAAARKEAEQKARLKQSAATRQESPYYERQKSPTGSEDANTPPQSAPTDDVDPPPESDVPAGTPRYDPPVNRKPERPPKEGRDGGSSGSEAVGIAIGVAAIAAAIAAKEQREKRKQACAEQLTSLHGRSVDEVPSALDASDFIIEYKERVPAPSEGTHAAGTVFKTRVDDLRDGRCVARIVHTPAATTSDLPVPPPAPPPEPEPVPPPVTAAIPPAPATPTPIAPPVKAQPAMPPKPKPPKKAPQKPPDQVAKPAPTPTTTPVEPPSAPRCRDPIEVPRLVGRTGIEATALLAEAQLQLQSTMVPSAKPLDEVLTQAPTPPALLACDAIVQLELSDGSLVVVPAVTGMPFQQARASVTDHELAAEADDEESDRSPGDVLAQEPAAGREVPRGTTVRLAVATGLVVPDVTGMDLIEAMQLLGAFRVVPARVDDDAPKDLITSQSPPAGTRAARGSELRLSISEGPFPPGWMKLLAALAAAALAALGIRKAVPHWIEASARIDADSMHASATEPADTGPSLQLDAHLERLRSRVQLPGEPT